MTFQGNVVFQCTLSCTIITMPISVWGTPSSDQSSFSGITCVVYGTDAYVLVDVEDDVDDDDDVVVGGQLNVLVAVVIPYGCAVVP